MGQAAAPLSNLLYGIEISGPDNVIGGVSPGDGNIVSANASAGDCLLYRRRPRQSCPGKFRRNRRHRHASARQPRAGHRVRQCRPQSDWRRLDGQRGTWLPATCAAGIGVFPGNGEVITGNTLWLRRQRECTPQPHRQYLCQQRFAGHRDWRQYRARHRCPSHRSLPGRRQRCRPRPHRPQQSRPRGISVIAPSARITPAPERQAVNLTRARRLPHRRENFAADSGARSTER